MMVRNFNKNGGMFMTEVEGIVIGLYGGKRF